ncbi:MAG: hypothetical protein GEV05_11170 [Betaproteobacteria bacterium]|nr:hypothetical protein [Betaproteobacteria bacterium]
MQTSRKPIQLRPVVSKPRLPLKPGSPNYPHVLAPYAVFELDTRGAVATIAALTESMSAFVATLHDPELGIDINALSSDAREGLAEVTDQLHAAGLLNPFIRKDGSITLY